MGTLRILEAVRACSLTKFTRVYQAGSSELFGIVKESPQNEMTPFHPRSPYGVSKQFSYWTMINYREAYGMHASNGILYNTESPRRSKDFVTRKITWTVARIKRGLQSHLDIGNLDAKRDWSHVQDFVRGMWLMLQQEEGDDYVLSSDVARPVREFVTEAFLAVGIDLVWTGEPGSVQEKGVDSADPSRVLVVVNPQFFRPVEVFDLRGDSQKARSRLNWHPSISFRSLVAEMVAADLAAIDREMMSPVVVSSIHS
jgi:GDPmannose 4,6-dehydratase